MPFAEFGHFGDTLFECVLLAADCTVTIPPISVQVDAEHFVGTRLRDDAPPRQFLQHRPPPTLERDTPLIELGKLGDEAVGEGEEKAAVGGVGLPKPEGCRLELMGGALDLRVALLELGDEIGVPHPRAERIALGKVSRSGKEVR